MSGAGNGSLTQLRWKPKLRHLNTCEVLVRGPVNLLGLKGHQGCHSLWCNATTTKITVSQIPVIRHHTQRPQITTPPSVLYYCSLGWSESKVTGDLQNYANFQRDRHLDGKTITIQSQLLCQNCSLQVAWTVMWDGMTCFLCCTVAGQQCGWNWSDVSQWYGDSGHLHLPYPRITPVLSFQKEAKTSHKMPHQCSWRGKVWGKDPQSNGKPSPDFWFLEE